jgi:putative ABC transport system substrate-binding protein
MMDRRAFIAAVTGSLLASRPSPSCSGPLAGGLLAAPLAAEAQQAGRVPRVGILAHAPGWTFRSVFAAGLRELGYVEGSQVVLEPRFADVEKPEQFDQLAIDLVRSHVDVIVGINNSAIAAAKRATSTIPIVMVISFDPVGQGLVRSLARPGANVTGLAWDANPMVLGKILTLASEALSRASRFGVLVDTTAPGLTPYLAALYEAAKRRQLELLPVEIRGPGDIDNAFASLSQKHAGAVVMVGGSLLFFNRARLANLAKERHLPLIFNYREGVDAGGLMSYGPSLPDLWRRAALYVDKILKGAKPDDLPVEQPTTYEFVINLKTAKALGLTIPQSLLQRADQVIE